MNRKLTFIALAVAGLASLGLGRGVTVPGALAADRPETEFGVDALGLDAANGADAGRKAVYTLINSASGNAVIIFRRDENGVLMPAGGVPTGGLGTGAGLGSQGALVLSDDGRWLFAVNAGSNEVSVLRVDESGLSLINRFGSGGTRPISIALDKGVLYVLNAGAPANITGFMLSRDGWASPIPGSARPLSGPAVAPAQVAFSRDGRWLVVTEKSTDLIDVFSVEKDGMAHGPSTYPSAGHTPFGFEFGQGDEMFVSEAGGTTSSYQLGQSGLLTTITGAAPTHQGAPCWLAVSKDGRFAYTANAASGTISAFSVKDRGMLELLDSSGATATVGPGNLDLAFSRNGRFLYQLRNNGTITTLRVEPDGRLSILGVVGTMPGSVAGLAAR